MEVYQNAASIARQYHIPSLVHVTEVTQPLGHSTSGSHERYKSKERLDWEKEFDCLSKMREWIIENGFASDKELTAWEKQDRRAVEQIRAAAWDAYTKPILEERKTLFTLLDKLAAESEKAADITEIKNALSNKTIPFRRDNFIALHGALEVTRLEPLPARADLIRWKQEQDHGTIMPCGSFVPARLAYNNDRLDEGYEGF